jgi:hypothetical protein
MQIKRTKLIELKLLGYVVGTMFVLYGYALACWHVSWLMW